MICVGIDVAKDMLDFFDRLRTPVGVLFGV